MALFLIVIAALFQARYDETMAQSSRRTGSGGLSEDPQAASALNPSPYRQSVPVQARSALSFGWFLCLCLLTSHHVLIVTAIEEEKQCSIFIAPSSLHGNTGFGVYTTRDLKAGDQILSGPRGTPDGPAITVVDPGRLYGRGIEKYDQWNNVMGHYWWGRGLSDHSAYEANEVVDYQITFGALPNHHCILGSMDMVFPDLQDNGSPWPAYDDSLSNRFRDPSAGAYSYHTGRIFFAQRNLPAGSELFLSYGYCNRDDLQNPESSALWYPDWAHHIPMQQDYLEATQAARVMWQSLLVDFNYDASKIPSNLVLTYEGEAFQHLTKQARSLLPNTTTALLHAMPGVENDSESENGDDEDDDDDDDDEEETSKQDYALTHFLAREYGTTPRSPEWVRENGMCIENLIPGISTLPQAGKGAFAQHFIAQGEMVVPVPLLHLFDKSALQLLDEDGEMKETQQQLLANYCFTHRFSSLMLCPTSNAILLNHCSDRTKSCGPNGPNAMVRWASPDWDPRTEQNLHATLEEIKPQLDRLLALEVVALRDIEPGTEVFIDYGPYFEEAWRAHVENWEPENPEEETTYFSIAEANANTSLPLEHLVSHSLVEEADHPYIFTGCLYWPTDLDFDEVFQEADVEFETMDDSDILNDYADDGSMYEGNYARQVEHSYWPCSVLLRDDNPEDSNISYLVRIWQPPGAEEDLPWYKNELPRFLYHFPRSSIRYFAKPYKSDLFLTNAFRHPIHIADEIFPKQWMDLLSEKGPGGEDL